ncbi:GntR family transcriptional regulator [Pelosinus fermentans]|uniref:Transcriptional regulator, GntR family with FCD sensor domain containing protein n=1 Tax=Pelosinus fermentans JBW45 TaxID=1192197 RepID=I9NT69_9FIRM|nr:GntR family transcriptional regulator [Pelosinus fermentans]AJQ26351.1 transcriptional regulator, GntR family with FCD sensor domain containing protein [Pelosinus fermentans JBW45]
MEVSIIEKNPRESTREYVYRFLKFNIMELKLIPGSALSEKDIAQLLNVSRTPVREAFIQLSQEYLLDILPQKGTYVSLIDIENVEESKFLRETVEKAVMAMACVDFPSDKLFELQSNIALQELCFKEKNYLRFYELDEEMHKIIFVGCKKARIWSMIQQMNTHYNRVRMLNMAGGYDVSPVLKQHKELILAIKEKDVDLGMRTIDRHLNKVKFDIQDLYRDYADYFKQKQSILL